MPYREPAETPHEQTQAAAAAAGSSARPRRARCGRARTIMPKYPGCGQLKDKVALITGGDSGIGRAVAVAMAREGAQIAIVYLEEHKDAEETMRLVERGGQPAPSCSPATSATRCSAGRSVERHYEQFGRIDILVNNAAEQHEADDPLDLTAAQIERTFRTNVFSFFHHDASARLQYMQAGASIINTTSITAYQRPQDPARLCGHQGRDRLADPLAVARRWSRRASASTASRPGRSGRRSSRHRSMPRRSPSTARARRWSAPASRTKSRPATCSSRARTPPT